MLIRALWSDCLQFNGNCDCEIQLRMSECSESNFILRVHCEQTTRLKMPKETHREFISRMVREYPKIFRADNNVLYCIVCDCKAPAIKLSSVKDHLDSKKHIKATGIRSKSTKNQTLVTSFQTSQAEVNAFHMDHHFIISSNHFSRQIFLFTKFPMQASWNYSRNI